MEESMEITVEQDQQNLILDFDAREHLSVAASWARVLAIIGFIGCGLIVLAGIFMTVTFYSITNRVPTRYSASGRVMYNSGPSFLIGFVYMAFAVLAFIGCLFLLRFANKMRAGLHEWNQQEINDSFLNLKKLFRYHGILTIVLIAFYVVILFAVMISALNR